MRRCENKYGRQATDGNTAHKSAIFTPYNDKNTHTFVL